MGEATLPIAMSPGVLAKSQIQQLFERGAITCYHAEGPEIDASAFDLRLSTMAWQTKR